MDHSTPGDGIRRVARLENAAWLIANGVKPLGRRIDGAGRFVTWDFPATTEVARLLDLLIKRDAGVRLMIAYAEKYATELRAVARMQGQHRRGVP